MAKSCSWSVYKHISPSGKIYVGITSKKCFSRWGTCGKRYLGKQKNGNYVHRYFAPAIVKYGWSNFQHIIIATSLREEEAKSMEIELILKYKSLGISYNITNGGDGRLGTTFTHRTESKQAISLHHRRFQSDITKKKISEIQKGVKFPKWRKTLLSKAHDFEKIRVEQYTKDGALLNVFDSLMEAERITGTPSGNISRVCKGKGKSANGFIWKYQYETNN